MSAQVRPQRNLNRQQVQEILERNIGLYREEEHFATYLVELALYLLEYEYDWAESGGAPPSADAHPVPAAEPAPQSKAFYSPVSVSKREAPTVAVIPVGVRNGNQAPAGERRIYSSTLQQPGKFARPHTSSKCPYCGVTVSDASLCPSCKHMIH